MRRLINRFACWLIGHDWYITGERHYGDFSITYSRRCKDCGKERKHER